MVSTLPRIPLFEALAQHNPQSTAIVHSKSQKKFTYGQLLDDVLKSKERLETQSNGKSVVGRRVAFLVENSYDYVVTLLSIIGSDAIAVPLCPSFPASELRYILNQCQASLLLASHRYHNNATHLVEEGLDATTPVVRIDKIEPGTATNGATALGTPVGNEGGVMLYTSGTTARPKGVLLPTGVLTAQSLSLLQAWQYSASDYLLHVLPLHHIHGTVNALITPLFAGSTIEFMYPFNADAVWLRFAAAYFPSQDSTTQHAKITFFTAVPAIYSRLIKAHPNLPADLQALSRTAITPANLRLNISGSAALPTPVKAAWSLLSNDNILLERFGMTEVGMALSCGLAPSDRVDASVGWPLPSVEARLVDSDTNAVIPVDSELDGDGKEIQGEIQLRGPTIFHGYWQNPTATAKEFVGDSDGKGPWFKTGDIAVRRTVPGAGISGVSWARGPMFFIHGRKSADIIKTGGEKVSALEIERELLSLPEISECAVVGVDSNQWGQRVAAVVVLSELGLTAGRNGSQWGAMDMRRSLKDRLANYKVPQAFKVVETIPRNAMGKVNKKQLVHELFPDAPSTP